MDYKEMSWIGNTTYTNVGLAAQDNVHASRQKVSGSNSHKIRL